MFPHCYDDDDDDDDDEGDDDDDDGETYPARWQCELFPVAML